MCVCVWVCTVPCVTEGSNDNESTPHTESTPPGSTPLFMQLMCIWCLETAGCYGSSPLLLGVMGAPPYCWVLWSSPLLLGVMELPLLSSPLLLGIMELPLTELPLTVGCYGSFPLLSSPLLLGVMELPLSAGNYIYDIIHTGTTTYTTPHTHTHTHTHTHNTYTHSPHHAAHSIIQYCSKQSRSTICHAVCLFSNVLQHASDC